MTRCIRKTQSRTGKIARLPHTIREEVNHRLRDNVPGKNICEWLNRLPKCKEVCAEFARRSGKEKSPVTVNQLSEWRRGGYQDWVQEQQVLEGTREMAQWSAKLAKNGAGKLSEGAAVLLSGQVLKLLQGIVRADLLAQAAFGEGKGRKKRTGETPVPLHGGDMEQLEAATRLVGALVKSLGALRSGDHQRAQIAQAERKLALRSEMVAMAREKHDQEAVEQKKLEREKRAEEQRRQKRDSGLSDSGKINWVRGELFGREHIIHEREAKLKEMQKDLEILKAQWQIDQGPSNGENAGESKVQSPKSNVATTESQSEPMSVNPSPSDQLPEKNVGGGEPEANFSTQKPLSSGSNGPGGGGACAGNQSSQGAS